MSTRALPKISEIFDFQILWTASGWSVHSSEETLFLDNMSAPWFILPGTCVAFSERRLFWTHTRRSYASVQSRFETRPPWWFMSDNTDLLSERISTLCPRMSGRRIDRPDTLLAFLGSWCAGPTPLRTIGRRSVCPRTALPNPCWKHLPWQPSFVCRDSQMGSLQWARADTQAESPLRGDIRDARP